MGYPMTYQRVVSRNGLRGDYTERGQEPDGLGAIRGDLRRLECDQRDILHLTAYARYAGITVGQAKLVLDAFLGDGALGVLSDEEARALRAHTEDGIQRAALEARVAAFRH